MGVADGVPTSWADEMVEAEFDLVKGQLAAGLLPADLSEEGPRDGAESMVSEPGGEGSGGEHQLLLQGWGDHGVLQGDREHAQQEQAGWSAQAVRAQRTLAGS